MKSCLSFPQTLAACALIGAAACGSADYSVLVTIGDLPSRAVSLSVSAQLDQKPLSAMSDLPLPLSLPLPQNQLGIRVPVAGQLKLDLSAWDSDGCTQASAAPTVDLSMRFSNLAVQMQAQSPRRCGGLMGCATGSACATPLTAGAVPRINGIWATAANDVWAVGTMASVLHFDGQAWSRISASTFPVPSDTIFNAVWASSSTDVWVVGNLGRILHYNGKDWTLSTGGPTRTLTAISGVSASHVWVVGLAASTTTQGEFWHYDGTRWNQINPFGNGSLYAVWAVSPSFVLGGGGDVTQTRLWKWNGDNMFTDYSGEAVLPVNSLWAESTSRAIAVGPAGQILRFDGAKWSLVTNSVSSDFYSVTGVGSTTYIVGTGGYAARSTDPLLKTFAPLSPSIGSMDLNVVQAAPNGLAWIGGNSGYLGFTDARP